MRFYKNCGMIERSKHLIQEIFNMVLVQFSGILPLLTHSPTSDAYSTLDQRGRRNTLDNTLDPADKDGVQVNTGLTPTHAYTLTHYPCLTAL